ncbi:family 78 glycoside hydrolase catalytic domain [Paenibacillus sepulcri]
MSKEWSAQWIWGGEEESPRNEWRCFRRNFEVPENPGETELRISADSRYVLYINGTQVGRGPVRSWPKEQFYDTYEVGHLLKAGRSNTIAVLVMHFGVANFYYIRGRGGLIAELGSRRTDGAGGLIVATDDSWKTSRLEAQDPRSPRMACQQGFADIYDARKWDESWNQNGFDDTDWASVHSIGGVGSGPWKTLVPRDIPFLTEEKMMPSRIESFQWVKTPAWTGAFDLRAAFMPGTVDHADNSAYSGYLATLLTLERSAKVTLGFAGGLRTENVFVDGIRCGDWYGVLPERFSDLQLDAGEHLLLIDISASDHGGSYHIAVDSAEFFELRSPISGGSAGETPFAMIGPFDTVVNVTYKGIRRLDLGQPQYQAAAGIRNKKDMDAFRDWIRPLPAAYYNEQDVLGANMWRTDVIRGNVTAQLEQGIIASPEPGLVPVSADGYDSELVIDFGREWSGFIGFEVEAEEGAVIDLYGLEYMNGDYRQHTYGLDNTIRYICREGRQQYLSPVRRGFRYLILTVRGAAKPVKLYDIYVNQSNYPVTEAGAFQSSDPLLNQIWEISRHTTRLCMEDTFVDCPAYEQVFWVGDSRNEALVNFYVYGSLDIVKRCLNLVPGSADITPLYLDQVPSAWNSVIPNWTFFWAIACAEYVEHTGDRAYAAEIWPAVRHTLEHYLTHIDDSGLLNIKGWNLLDWAPMDQPDEGIVTHQNMFLYKTLRKADGLAAAAGEAGSAFPGAADSLLAAINEQLWDEVQQAYLDCIHTDGRRSDIFSMQTQVVASLCRIAEGERKERVAAYLVQPPKSFVQIGSPFMSFFYYEALAQAGHYGLMLEDIRANYGQMIEHGATTCWEMYPNFAENRASADMLTRSHCHAWSAAPGYFLGESILGVKRVEDGWRRAAIAPQPCGLSWAKGKVPLPQGGRIEVEWHVEGNLMKLSVSAPEDVELDILIPEGLTGEVQIVKTPEKGSLTLI